MAPLNKGFSIFKIQNVIIFPDLNRVYFICFFQTYLRIGFEREAENAAKVTGSIPDGMNFGNYHFWYGFRLGVMGSDSELIS